MREDVVMETPLRKGQLNVAELTKETEKVQP